MIRRRRLAVGAVLAAALALRLAHWAAVRRLPFVAALAMDSAEYDRWAREIAAGDWLGSQVFFQAPLYPYLAAALYLLFGPHPDAVYLTQIACAVAGCWALYRAGRLMVGESAALAAAALAAVYGPFIFHDVQILKESLAVDVAAFLLWALAAARQGEPGVVTRQGEPGEPEEPESRLAQPEERARPESRPAQPENWIAQTENRLTRRERQATRETWLLGRWLVAGILLGVLSLLRENALLTVPLLLPLAWPAAAPALGDGQQGSGERRGGEQGSGQRDGGRRTARWAGFALRGGAFGLGVVLLLAPVAWRNGKVGGSYLPTTSQGGVNFYIGNNPRADGTYRPVAPGRQTPAFERLEAARIARQEAGRPLSPAEVSRFWLGKALRWAAAHPGDWLRLQLAKLALFWSWYEWPDAVDYYFVRGLSPVYRLPLLEFGGATLLAAAGLLLARRRRRALAPALLFFVAWMLSTVAFFLFSRYRLPAMPALLLLAGLPVAAVPRAWAAWRRGRLAAAARVPAPTDLPGRSGRLVEAAPLSAPMGSPDSPLAAVPPAGSAASPAGPDAGSAGGPGSAGEPGSAGGSGSAGRDLAALIGLAALIVAAFALPRALEFEPRLDLVYYNLGRLEAEAGRPEAARRHYQQVVALDPGNFLAWLNLGSIAARERDWSSALACFSRAAALAPDSDDAQSNLGGVLLAFGRLDDAAAHLDRALALDPDNPQALQNAALLRLRRGDRAGAAELNRRLLALQPENAAALRLRARLLGGR
jgi:hypothetical protein